jgi:tryptophan-rich sensory protein
MDYPCCQYNLNLENMGNLLYLVAVVLVIIWAISFFGGYYTGGIIHALLVIAVIAVVLRLIRSAA